MAYMSVGLFGAQTGGHSDWDPKPPPSSGFLSGAVDFIKGAVSNIASIPSKVSGQTKVAVTESGSAHVAPAGFMGMSPMILLGGAALIAFLVLKKK